MKKQIIFECSPEQQEVIADHALSASREEIKLQPDERAWILANAQARSPGCRVLSADLDIENGVWIVSIETTVSVSQG